MAYGTDADIMDCFAFNDASTVFQILSCHMPEARVKLNSARAILRELLNDADAVLLVILISLMNGGSAFPVTTAWAKSWISGGFSPSPPCP